MQRLFFAALLALALACGTACSAHKDAAASAEAELSAPAAQVASAAPVDDGEDYGGLDDYDDFNEEDAALQNDPLEGWNRFWFGFNDIFYVYVAKPAYTAWETITPHQVREGLSNFWHNLLFPMRFVNNLLQFRFMEAGVEFARFIANSTAGMGGFIDVAKYKKPVVPVHPEGEDFGQTLGRWGIPHGCYLVWPFIGPSSVRETFGWAGDYFAYPGFAVGYAWKAPWYVISGIEVGFFFNDLDDVLPTYMSIRDAAVDPYIMMREAWVRYRAIQVAR